jgi:hypothetical protein
MECHRQASVKVAVPKVYGNISLLIVGRAPCVIVALASLCTVRVVAAAIANGSSLETASRFLVFMFASIALVKRYLELAMRIDRDLPMPSLRYGTGPVSFLVSPSLRCVVGVRSSARVNIA